MMPLFFFTTALYAFCFFFSSRRRHTRFDCDWSSDVCSSDLLFEFVDANSAQRLVVDLRFNGGGYPALFDTIIDGLTQRPWLAQNGNLIVLTGNMTFSSGVWHAVALRNMGAVIIGEPTSGRPNGYGQVRRLYLPNSGIGLQYSTRYWQLIDDSDPSTVMPDVLAAPTISDYFAGRDVALEAALTYSRP